MYKPKRLMYQNSILNYNPCMDEISEITLINLFYRARLNKYRNSKMFISSLNTSRNTGMRYISNFDTMTTIYPVFHRGYMNSIYKDGKNMADISIFEEIGWFQEEWEDCGD